MAASLAPGSSVSVVARRYDVNANQVFAWRKRFRPESGLPAMVPLVVRPDPPSGSAGDEPDARIEIELGAGYRIHIGGGVRADALRLVLEVLERR